MAMNVPIFPEAVSDWTDLQVEFIRYCHYYYSLRTDPQGPDDDTIQDEFKLVQWLEKKELEDRKQAIREKAATKGKNTEVFNIGGR